MNWIQKIIGLVAGQNSFLRNIFILLIITRLIFLENNQLFLAIEVLGSIIIYLLEILVKSLDSKDLD